MFTKIAFSLALALVLTGVFSSDSSHDSSDMTDVVPYSGIKPNGITVIRTEGSSMVSVEKTPNPFNPDAPDVNALCFLLDMIRVETDEKIGTAKECGIIEPDEGSPEECETATVIVTTTYYQDDGNTLTSRESLTLQPTASVFPETWTHIVGTIPPPALTQSILYGTGIFKCSEGSVRIAGILDMRELDLGAPQGFMRANSLHVLDLSTECDLTLTGLNDNDIFKTSDSRSVEIEGYQFEHDY